MAIKKVPSGMGPTFNQPQTSSVQVIVNGLLEVKSNNPNVKIVKKE